MRPTNHTLTIVIPALNEEAAITATVERCLDAREQIIRESSVRDIELIVVSDGSTDRTESFARGFSEITVLAFDENRGYGAAIKCGFEHGNGDLLAFLDADGTCDPRVFAELCRAIDEQKADVVLGSRMGPESQMPLIRSVGNTLFAWMLGLLSKRRIRDTASGMRVIRRSALADIYPLPDGLHFTPAMSARVLLEGKLSLVEIPMAYAERVGRSKLSVLHDGIRFLSSIVQASLCYRPARPILVIVSIVGLLALATGLLPVTFYLQYEHLEEWMIYRILLSSLLITIGGFLICTAVVADRIAAAAHGRAFAVSGVTAFLAGMFVPRVRWVAGPTLLVIALMLVWPGIVEFFSTGHVIMHWSRAMLASQLVLLAAMLTLTTFVLNIVDLVERHRSIHQTIPKPDRLRSATIPNP